MAFHVFTKAIYTLICERYTTRINCCVLWAISPLCWLLAAGSSLPFTGLKKERSV